MEILLFFSLIFSLIINFAMGAMSFSGVNRTLLSMYRGLIEVSVAFIDDSGAPIEEPYFKKDVLEQYVTDYLEENLTRYVTSYKASIYYFERESEIACTSKECDAVKISLDCKINFFFHYTKAKNYYINSKL